MPWSVSAACSRRPCAAGATRSWRWSPAAWTPSRCPPRRSSGRTPTPPTCPPSPCRRRWCGPGPWMPGSPTSWSPPATTSRRWSPRSGAASRSRRSAPCRAGAATWSGPSCWSCSPRGAPFRSTPLGGCGSARADQRHPAHAVGVVAGQVAGELEAGRPALAECVGGGGLAAGGDRHLPRHLAVVLALPALLVAALDRVVAEDELVVDRVGVAEQEPHRGSRRDPDHLGLEP